ncbi:RE1, partial [Symbiodinium pilosum]
MGTVLVLQLFETLEEVQQIFSRASRRRPLGKASSWATGAFTHGGVSGLRDGAKRLPNVTKFLAKFAQEVMGVKQFASVVLQRNGGGRAHRDFHNRPGSRNWLCPLTSFQDGGLWTELEDEEALRLEGDMISKEVKPGVEIKGKIIKAEKGKVFSFDPMKWHEVQPHRGERVMMIAYTPRLSNLSEKELEYLKDLGFLPFGEEENDVKQGEDEYELPLDEVDPEADIHECRSSLISLNEAHGQLLEDLQDRSQSLRLLLEEERLLAEDLRQAGTLVEEEAERVQDCITQMCERAAQRLSTCDRAVLKVCLKAAAEPNEPDYERLLELLEGDLQVVHTVPLQQVRPVVNRWHAAISKELNNLIKGGTLEEISREEARRLERQGVLRLVPSKGVYTLKPPGEGDTKYKRKYRLVLCGNFAAPEEQFGSLYAGGASAETFRTVLVVAAQRKWQGATADITGAFLLAPWPEHLHRYAVVPPRLLIENNYIAEEAFWLVRGPLYGLRESPAVWAAYRSKRFSQARISYKNRHLVLRVSKADPELWLIAFEDEEDLVGCIITYVDDLFYLSESEIVVTVHAWVVEEWPCSALEWASAPGGTRYLGMEVFQRSSGAFEIHQRGYILDLLRSHGMQDAPGTLLPCPKEWVTEDISGDPEDFSESESYGASVVTVNGGPVAWKAGKQAMTTLSTMESELLEATNAATLLECIGCLVDEICGRRIPRQLRVDNSAATAMLCGGAGSWRTRHLRVRCSFIREQVQRGLLEVSHVEGRRQLADLSTKMHPRVRLLDLLQQWGFEGFTDDMVQLQAVHVVVLSCVVLALDRLPGAEAASSDKDKGKDPLPASGMDELLMVSGIVALVAVVVWELIKSFCGWLKRSTKRESKLQRLREMAKHTVKAEIAKYEAARTLDPVEVQRLVRQTLVEATSPPAARISLQVPAPELNREASFGGSGEVASG